MTDNTIEKALSACDTEGFGTSAYKLDCATGTQRSKDITTLIAKLSLAGFLACKNWCAQYVQVVHAQQAFPFRVGGRK